MDIYSTFFDTASKENILFVIYMQENWDPLTWSDTCVYKVYYNTKGTKTVKGGQQ